MPPTRRVSGEVVSSGRDRQRADRGCRAQQPEPLRAGVEDFVGEDRQQRGGAAEQDREQIQRDDAEHDRIAADVGDAGEERLEAYGGAVRDEALDVNEGQQDHRCQKERGAGGVGNGRPEGVENAADRGAGDGRKLGGGSGRRDRARKQRDRHDCRQQGLLGRQLERPSDPEHEHRGQDELPRHPAGDGTDGQGGGGEALQRLADLQQAAPVVAVGHLARHQHERRHRQELDQPDQPEVERTAGERIHLPGHRHPQHLKGQGGAGPCAPIEHEWAMPQDRVRRGFSRVHGRLTVVAGHAGEVRSAHLRRPPSPDSGPRQSAGFDRQPLSFGG